MPAYRRKRSLGCEQLERKIAPSSVLFGAGKRASLQDAQAFDATQVEQAAFYLAASAVLSQSASVANVAPVTLDEPVTGSSEGAVVREDVRGFCGVLYPLKIDMIRFVSGDWTEVRSPRLYVICGVPYGDDSGSTPDIPSVDPISPETPSEQSPDADAEGAVPDEEQPAGGDELATEDSPPVADDKPVARDEVSEPVVEDAGLPDDTYADDTGWYANDPEDLGPVDPEHANEDFTGSNSPAEDGSPVVDDAPVDGDEVTEPISDDTGIPDDTSADDTSWYADDFEDLGPVDSEYADEEITVVDDGSSENTSESAVVEYHSDDAVVGADG